MVPADPITPACVSASVRSAPVEAIAPAPSVAQLLSESRQHALNRVKFGNRLTGTQHKPAYAAAEEEATLALQKRLQAHDLDPDHTDPAWALDAAPHADIVGFLAGYGAIP